MIAEASLLCLALAMYSESRGESEDGQVAVAAIIMNRLEDDHYPKSICKIVKHHSWNSNRPLSKVKEKAALYKAKQLAQMYISGKIKNPVGPRLYFNQVRLGKRFKTPNSPLRIDGHLFY